MSITGTALCPTCGERCSALGMDRDFQEVYPMVEMWPGGPKVEATWELPRTTLASETWTFEPCGHVLPGEGLTITFVDVPVADAAT